MRLGQNSKSTKVGVSSKKAGTTFASTSKTLSLNYLNLYLVITFVKARLRIIFLFSFRCQI